jgi:RND superfamily putative drug exporter
MLTALADRGIRRPRRVLAVAFVAFLVAAAFGGPVAGLLDTNGGFDAPGSPSVRALATIERASGLEASPGLVAVVDTPHGAASADGRARVAAVRRMAASDPGIGAVRAAGDPGARGLVARDGRSALVLATLRADASESAVVAHATDRVGHMPGVTLGGSAVTGEQVSDQVSSDLGRAELLAFPVLALLALLFFRGARAAALPLMVGLLAVTGTFLALRLINGVYGLSVYALNVVFGLGLGLAIDFALYLVSRFREELAAGREVPEAVQAAMATAGRTVVFSSLTVGAAMLSLVAFPQQFLRSIGIGGAVVALVAAASALTILPALFAVMGRRLMPRRGVSDPAKGRWARTAAAVLRRPGLVAGVTALVMLVVALPTLRTQWTGVDATVLPASHSARAVADRLSADYPQLSSDPVVLAVRAPASAAPAVAAYAARVARVDGVASVSPPQRLDARTWRIDAVVPGSAVAPAAQRTVAAIGAVAHPFPVDVGGAAARFADGRAAISRNLPIALGALVLTTLFLLWLMTGSAVLPLKALIMSFLTLGVTTGVLVLVFQDGRFESLLGYQSQGGIEQSDFLVLVAIAFALSTDYGVFLLGRIKEARDRGQSDREAIVSGIGATGRLVSAAAILLAVAVAAFATSEVVFIKEIGVGAVVAVLVDAFIVRALLVPSTMALLGRANWWSPRFLRRLHEKIPADWDGSRPDPAIAS